MSKERAPDNFLRVIEPYKFNSIWVFDDSKVDLFQEPFVSGADTILEHISLSIPEARHGFLLYFAPGPFPGYQYTLVWQREEFEGNWYKLKGTSMEGWLCPAMQKYFSTAPKEIYFKAEEKK